MVVAVVTRSAVVVAGQVLCDFALASYVSLLVRAARASGGAVPERRNAVPERRSAVAVQPAASDSGWAVAYNRSPAAEAPVRLRAEVPEDVGPVTRYVPAHALRQVDLRVVNNSADDRAEASYAEASYGEESYGDESYGDESYGDFDSYASLALATAR
jgi:hypothetical protein